MRGVVSVAVWVTGLLGVAACETPASDRPAVMRLRLTHVAEGPRGVRVAPDRLEALTGVPFRDAARFERVPEGDPSDGALPARLWFAVTEGAGDARRVSLSLVVDLPPRHGGVELHVGLEGAGTSSARASAVVEAGVGAGVDDQGERDPMSIPGTLCHREPESSRQRPVRGVSLRYALEARRIAKRRPREGVEPVGGHPYAARSLRDMRQPQAHHSRSV